MKSSRNARRRRYGALLTGRGLEIGALGDPLPVPHAAEVLYSDVLTPEQIDAMYPGSRHPDILSDSERYPTVASNTFDFVVANHVLEHVTDVLEALIEWHRILRPGGLLLLSVPDKRYTFDHARRRTPLEHLDRDYASNAAPDRLNECHLLEWAEHVEHLRPETAEFDRWVAEQKARGYAVHNHVWVLQDVLRIVRHLANHYATEFALARWSNTSALGNEFTLLLRKGRYERRHTDFALLCALSMHPIHELLSRIRRGAKQLRTVMRRRTDR